MNNTAPKRRTNKQIDIIKQQLKELAVDRYISQSPLTIDDIKDIYKQNDFSHTDRSIQRDLQKSNIKYIDGTYQFFPVIEFKEICSQLSNLLSNLNTYKPIQISQEVIFNDNENKFKKAPSITYYRIVITHQQGIENKEHLRRVHDLVVEYFSWIRPQVLDGISSVEINDTSLVYELHCQKKLHSLFQVLYFSKYNVPTFTSIEWCKIVKKNRERILNFTKIQNNTYY